MKVNNFLCKYISIKHSPKFPYAIFQLELFLSYTSPAHIIPAITQQTAFYFHHAFMIYKQ